MSDETISNPAAGNPSSALLEPRPGRLALPRGSTFVDAWSRLMRLCRWTQKEDRVFHEFALVLQEAREPAQIHAELVACAGRLAGADRVELIQDHGPGRHDRQVATWPVEPSYGTVPVAPRLTRLPGPSEEERSLGIPGSGELVAFRTPRANRRSTLSLPLRFGGHALGTLRVWARVGGRGNWPPRLVRRLTILATMSAAAERALQADRVTDVAAARDPVTGLRNVHFLAAFLASALDPKAPAQRHVTLLCVGFERMGRIRDEHSIELVDALLQRVAQTIVQTVRQTDVVARHDDRILIALMGTTLAHAMRVAKSVRHAVLEAGVVSAVSFRLSCSVGVAGFPEHAHDAESLIQTAYAAYISATRKGGPKVATFGAGIQDFPATRNCETGPVVDPAQHITNK